jgi:Zn-dependent protease with chaperone function
VNFFEHQAIARRQTGRLVVYFLVAVALTVLAVNAGIYFFARFFAGGAAGNWLWHAWSKQVLIGVLLLIMGGSLLEYLRLRSGGKALAEMIGARRIDFATTDPGERQFINVVAEMAIASGVAAPTLYVMDRENGINAFVAGLSLDQTVMVVTAGALEAFDRNELQAVVGHEFSHILNGDMRLNVRLLALLAGILAIGQLGSFLMRIASESSSSRSNRRGGVVHLFFLGLLLWTIGAIGLFFGRLIKAAISRQREFLADASSVQFTRNQDGLAEALLKIKHHAGYSWLDNLRAESMSHMCFAESLGFSSWFATHPPLDARIGALGKQYLVRDRARLREMTRQTRTAAEVSALQGEVGPGQGVDLAPLSYVTDTGKPAVSPAAVTLGPAALLGRAGTVSPRDLASAQALYRRLPPGVLQALETCEGAQALLYALLARQSKAPRSELEAFVARHERALSERIFSLMRILDGLDNHFALPLSELALPRLFLMEEVAQRELLARLQGLAQLDGMLSTFEFALLMVLRKQLLPAPRMARVSLAQSRPAAAILVAALMRRGGLEGEKLERSYLRLMRTIFSSPPSLPPAELTSLPKLAKSLQVLAGLALSDRRCVLELAATAVMADADVRLEEYELLRVVAAYMNCPMPLLDV